MLMSAVPSIANVAVVVVVIVLVVVVSAASLLPPERRPRRRLLLRRHLPRAMPWEEIGTTAASSSFLLPYPSRRSRRSPSIPPLSRLIGPDSRLSSSPSDVREIMDFIRRTFPDEKNENENGDEKDNGVGWSRTRNYLYRHRASCRRAALLHPPPPSPVEMDERGRRDRNGSRSRSGQLTTRSVSLVLSFLGEAFPNRPDLHARILKNTPRILGRWESIDSRLWPTVDFLRGLYGGMTVASSGGGTARVDDGDVDDDGWGMFHEAIYRNTDLLLVRGVGYASAAIDDNDDDGAPRRRNGRARVRRRGACDGGGTVAYEDCASMTMEDVGSACDGGSTADETNNAVEGYLRNELGVLMSSSDVAKLKRDRPTLFQLSLDGTVRPAVDYLRSLLLLLETDGGGDDDVSSLVDSDETAPSSSHSSSSSSSRWNRKARRVLKRVVTNHPTLLQLDVESNLRPTACFLRDSCGFNDAELAMVISATPGLLGLSVSRNIGPTIGYIRDILADGDCGAGTPDDDGCEEDREGRKDELRMSLRRCILKHPQILSLSLDNLRAKREYFDDIDRAGTPSQTKDDAEGGEAKKNKTTLAARIVVAAPSTYSLSLTENIVPKVEYLARLWGGDNRTKDVIECWGRRNSLSDNLREFPVILTLSLEDNIIPTLSFFNMTGYIRLDINSMPQINESPIHRQKVVIRSRYMATSLYNRLLPRWHFLLQEREKQQLSWHAHIRSEGASDASTYAAAPVLWEISSSSNSAHLPPLHLLAGANDEVFCREMKLSLKEYLEFKKEAVARLKFASQFDRWLKTGRPIDLSAVSSREK
jgi:hypothetical protein